MAYTKDKQGQAVLGNYMQIPSSITSGIVEGPHSESFDPPTRYAQLVYIAGGNLGLSGNVSAVDANYSQLIRVSGDYMYVMKTQTGLGTTSGDALWQIQRIYSSGDDTNIEWADGNDLFDNVAANYPSLTYSL